MRENILVIGPNAHFNEETSLWLQAKGYEVNSATTEAEALRKLHADIPILFLIDVSETATEMDSWQFCQSVRAVSDLPIVVITAVDDQDSRTRVAELDVDGYLVPPLTPETLITEVKSVLQSASLSTSKKGVMLYIDENLSVNLCARQVEVRGRFINLTPKEFDLLSCLVKDAGRLFTCDELMEQVWNGEEANRAALKAYIWRLRQKIEQSPHQPQYILTRRGIGYFFKPLS
jgi:DNA-binding response OmpR family regulator